RVFDMFARIDRPGGSTEPGLGIGLALARRLAEMHGGTLTAASEGEGRGTTFTLTIPTSEALPEPEMAPANDRSLSNGTAPLAIVVVEDNDDIAEGLSDWLEQLGHRVALARNGKSGVELIRERQPDLVLCDLGLPELDGLDVCRHVRAGGGDQ